MRFASFLSGGFITAIVVNPPERKLAKRISVHCAMQVSYNGRTLDDATFDMNLIAPL